MLITIRTKKGVIITTAKNSSVELGKECLVLEEGKGILAIANKDIISVSLDDFNSKEQSYTFPNVVTESWRNASEATITISIHNKYIRKFLLWIFQPQKIKIK